jgi:hypothetical protein
MTRLGIAVTPYRSASSYAASARPLGVTLLIAGMVAVGFALTMLVFYPGYMTNDATFVYDYSREWRFGDWQSPLMSIIWAFIDPLAPGPGSMFLLIATLYWLGFGMLALIVARRSVWLGIVVPLLALLPPAFMLLGMIWRDILFAGLWLVAAVIAFAAAERVSASRWPLQALTLGLIALGILLRPNAIVAAPLLIAYAIWPARFDWKRTALVFVPAFIAGYALVNVVYYGILDVKREYPLHSLLVFDLGGITHFTGENQFPVAWSPQEAALLTTKCYDPERWDSYWTMEPCRFVMQRLERKDEVIFGTPQLTAAWMRAVAAHPLAYLTHRATFMWTLLFRPILTLELYQANDPAKTPLAQNRYFQSAVALHDMLKRTVLFRIGFWLVLAITVCAWAWRTRATAAGAFAIGVTGSAIVYVMTFLPVGVAAEFRYGYWCVLATLAGAVATLIARRHPA